MSRLSGAVADATGKIDDLVARLADLVREGKISAIDAFLIENCEFADRLGKLLPALYAMNELAGNSAATDGEARSEFSHAGMIGMRESLETLGSCAKSAEAGWASFTRLFRFRWVGAWR